MHDWALLACERLSPRRGTLIVCYVRSSGSVPVHTVSLDEASSLASRALDSAFFKTLILHDLVSFQQAMTTTTAVAVVAAAVVDTAAVAVVVTTATKNADPVSTAVHLSSFFLWASFASRSLLFLPSKRRMTMQ